MNDVITREILLEQALAAARETDHQRRLTELLFLECGQASLDEQVLASYVCLPEKVLTRRDDWKRSTSVALEPAGSSDREFRVRLSTVPEGYAPSALRLVHPELAVQQGYSGTWEQAVSVGINDGQSAAGPGKKELVADGRLAAQGALAARDASSPPLPPPLLMEEWDQAGEKWRLRVRQPEDTPSKAAPVIVVRLLVTFADNTVIKKIVVERSLPGDGGDGKYWSIALHPRQLINRIDAGRSVPITRIDVAASLPLDGTTIPWVPGQTRIPLSPDAARGGCVGTMPSRTDAPVAYEPHRMIVIELQPRSHAHA